MRDIPVIQRQIKKTLASIEKTTNPSPRMFEKLAGLNKELIDTTIDALKNGRHCLECTDTCPVLSCPFRRA